MIKTDLSKCNIELVVLLNKYDTTLREIRHHLNKTQNFDKNIFVSTYKK